MIQPSSLGRNFEKAFNIFDPSKPHYGFTSWDNFFTQKVRQNVHPVASPSNNKVIVNTRESAPFNIEYNCKNAINFG